MDNKWQFDEEFLKKNIKDGKQLLKRHDISDVKKGLIQETIYQFSEFLDILNDNYIKTPPTEPSYSNFTVIKNNFLHKAMQDFHKYGDGFIDFIIYLSDNHTYLSFDNADYFTKTDPELIVNRGLEVYQEYFPEFYPTTQSIVEYPIPLINFSSKKTIGSQCFYDAILQLPFIHVEKSDEFPPSFIHELQHGVEGIRGYRSYIYFRELGPILMETLYIDKMVKNREVDATILYLDRVMEAEAFLDYLSCYFKVLKELRKLNFSVSSGELINILRKNQFIYEDKMELSSAINENFDDYMMYLISFFKSLEIREKIYQDRKYGLKLLKKALVNNSVVHLDEESMLQTYENYLYEISKKQKNYPHTKTYHK